MRLLLSLFILTVIDAQIPLDRDECVKWHNYYRRIHQAPDVRWSNSLARDAQSWANDLAARNAFQHSSGNDQGENLYWRSADTPHSCRKAIQGFYDEVKFYNYKGYFIKAAGHFTQVVWVKSTEIGVGKATTRGGAITLVFRYRPAGNVIGRFNDNVKRPIILKTITGQVPTGAPTGEVPTETDAQIPLDRDECVQWHNYYRRIHQAPDVRWSNILARDAQSWANDLAARNVIQHSSGNDQGENLYWRIPDTPHSCRKAIQGFYDEVKFYNYQGYFIKAAGHFTQVVWVKSIEIGVGKAVTRGGGIILVFRYRPAGNVIGRFNDNVKRPIILRTITGQVPTGAPTGEVPTGKAFIHHPSLIIISLLFIFAPDLWRAF